MRFILRADASVGIGTGHVMRSMALGQALQEASAEVCLVAAEIPEGLRIRLEGEGIEVHKLDVDRASEDDAMLLAALCNKMQANAAVLDGYAFDRGYQSIVRATGTCLGLIDDGGQMTECVADVLVNPNLYASEETYAGCTVQRVLLGRRYALLRREFWTPPPAKVSLRTRRVLITMGGSDPDNVAGKVLRALKRSSVDHLELRVIVGAGNPYAETVRHQASRSGHSAQVLTNVSDMREQFEWADVAVSGAGNTALELACSGVAAVYLVLVENQEPVARAIRKFGFGKVLGWHEDVAEEQIRAAVRDLLTSSEERDRMGQWGRELVDGQGALRVAASLMEMCT